MPRFSISPRSSITASLLLLWTAGCPAPLCTPGASESCACPNGETGAQVCNDDGAGYGACLCEGDPTPEVDAGSAVDAGEVDAGDVDAGEVDAGDIDAGEVDAGQVDAGDIDAGEVDAGDVDAGRNDAGPSDAGAIFDGGVVVDGGFDASPADAGLTDAGTDAGPADAGVVDAGPQCSNPPIAGEMGGQCVNGDTCNDGIPCQSEFSELPNGLDVTLGNTFDIPLGTPDPDNADEFIDGAPSTVRFNFAPGGQCAATCKINTINECGDCASCASNISIPAITSVGISPRTFIAGFPATDDGICRANCAYDPTGTTNGGCDVGYTCDARTNTCVEACLDNDQCNLSFGVSQREGLVAVIGNAWTCNTTSGQCEHPENGSTVGSPCVDDSECPSGGSCGDDGRCFTYACTHPDQTSPSPIPCAGECLGIGGNAATLCLANCTGPADCFPGQACLILELGPGAGRGICTSFCDDDTQCQTQQRCDLEDLGPAQCDDICDPNLVDGIVVPGAVVCGASDACVKAFGFDHGFCRRQNQLCREDDNCLGLQACKVAGSDLYGRCADGCADDAECVLGDRCVVQPSSGLGVCRRPGEACSASPIFGGGGGEAQPLLGDTQCIPGEFCSQVVATDPRTTGVCTP